MNIMKKLSSEMNLSELRKLGRRNWDEIKSYNSIVVIPSRKKHESGYALMYIIGIDPKGYAVEIAAACDDICWKIPKATDHDFRTDMFYPSGAIHFWSCDYEFMVGASLSSTDITLIKKNK